jgi:hypothetical protein
MGWSLGTFGGLRLDKGGAILEQLIVRKAVCMKRLSGHRKKARQPTSESD